MTNNFYILISIPILIVIGILLYYCYYYINPKQIIIRTLSNLEEKSATSFKTNELLKVVGKAMNIASPLEAPFSKRKCVFYTIQIDQKKGVRGNSYWKTIYKEEKIQEFYVKNKEEYILIKTIQNPRNYLSYVVTAIETYADAFKDPTPEFLKLLNDYHIETKDFLGINKHLRYKEGIIAIDEKIIVAGMPKWKPLIQPIAEYPFSKIVTLESNSNQKLIFTDLPLIAKRRNI